MDELKSEKTLEPQNPVDTSPPTPPGRTPSLTHKHDGPYTFEQRKQAVETFLKSSMTIRDFSRVWGIGEPSITLWLKRYKEGGPKGLEAHKPGPRGRPRRPGIREAITGVKQRFPDFGLRKVRDFLFRYHGVKVSTGSVRNALREKGLNKRLGSRRIKKVMPPRRFERSKPGELWQSDITSFVLPRHKERIYLTVFLDDYSRYIVSWGLYLHQKQDIVIETLLDGIERFGKPKEVLTDQGRQYFAWRGRGDFQKVLLREGIQHVVARTHHPQTVGKTERFWATVGEEFWERVQPQDFTEAKERFGHFVAHYNHFRPHQGIDGMVPADRFFGVEHQVRQALEKAMSRNELHLALGEKPRNPVFLVGQVGNQQVSLHGERGRIIFQTQDGNLQEMGLEGLGALGGKDGNEQSRRGSNTRPTEETQSAGQEPKIQATQGRAQADEVVVGFSYGGGKTEGPQGGRGDIGELVGAGDSTGDRREIGGSADESVADVAAGVGGAGGRPAEATEGPENNRDGLAPGGRSSRPEKADSLPGEGLGNDEGVGGVVKGISSQPGVENGG
jgi:transposase InsO family protein